MTGGNERQFVLGVDLDGVVADFARGLKPIAAEWLGVPAESLTDEISYGFGEWGLERAGGYDALHRFAVKERELFARLPPIAGAPAALRRLSAIGDVRIRIITHRLYIHWFHKEAIRQTTEWLEAHGIPYWDLCFMRDKAAVGAHLYVEDSPENIRSLRAAGYETIVVVNSTNRDLAGPRAESWEGIEQLVRERVGRWKAGDR
ncbi:MAG: 5'-nucleotidase [Gammaproteobacteria bacterium]|nr:5'-nucleotidase [Gammaproteobacteria bacterium]